MPNLNPNHLHEVLGQEATEELLSPVSVDPSVAPLLGSIGMSNMEAQGLPPRSSDPASPDSAPVPSELSTESLELKESLLEPQIVGATLAFNAVAEHMRDADLTDKLLLRRELGAWLTNSKLDYVRQQMEQDPELTFTLVATPNTALSGYDELFAAAKGFGKGGPSSPQAHKTWIYDEQMNGNLYQAYDLGQLAREDPDAGIIQFSLMPNRKHSELSGKTAQTQREMFTQDIHPAQPDLKVPSVLEAVTYWHALRNQLPKNPDSSTPQLADFNATLIRHFDLTDKNGNDVRVDDLVLVPASLVDGNGRQRLGSSFAGRGSDARLSLG